jgi:hypothetical protein
MPARVLMDTRIFRYIRALEIICSAGSQPRMIKNFSSHIRILALQALEERVAGHMSAKGNGFETNSV